MCRFVFCSFASHPFRSWILSSFGGFVPALMAPGEA